MASTTFKEIQSGNSDEYFPVAMTFMVDNKVYMLQHSDENNKFVVTKIQSDGELGKIANEGNWDHFFNLMTVLEQGKNRYLCCSNDESHVVYLFNISTDGVLTKKTSFIYKSDATFSNFVPYLVNNHLCYYRQNKAKMTWVITEIITD